MKYRFCLLIAALALAQIATAQTQQCDGVSFPGHVTVQGRRLTLNGLGLRTVTWFHIKVYVGALYLAHPSADAAAILAAHEPNEIVLHFLRSVSTSELRDAWRDGFAKSAPRELGRLKGRIARLNSWMRSVHSGQRMVFVYTPGRGVRYFLDGKLEGTIRGGDFATALLGIWLGPKPPGRRLKAALLEGKCG